jgi:hypothetical protein
MAHVHRAHLARIEWLVRGWCYSYTRRHAADALRQLAPSACPDSTASFSLDTQHPGGADMNNHLGVLIVLSWAALVVLLIVVVAVLMLR